MEKIDLLKTLGFNEQFIDAIKEYDAAPGFKGIQLSTTDPFNTATTSSVTSMKVTVNNSAYTGDGFIVNQTQE